MRIYDFHLKIPVPEKLDRLLVEIVLIYRRLRYGYEFRRILLTRGQYAIVDAEDYERLINYKWHTNQSRGKIYAVNSRMEKMHRMIMNAPNDMFVDHKNGDGRDNRKANLRLATPMQNTWNVKGASGKSQYKGVKWHKRIKKWAAVISVNGKRRHLGYFEDEDAAARAYDKVVKEERGEFGVLNFSE